MTHKTKFHGFKNGQRMTQEAYDGFSADIIAAFKPEPAPKVWTPNDAVAACEGFDGESHTVDEMISAWQYLIDTGLAWSLQGFFGRQAAALINQGVCAPPKKDMN